MGALKRFFGIKGKNQKTDAEKLIDEAWPKRAMFSDSCRTQYFGDLGTGRIEWLEAAQHPENGLWQIMVVQYEDAGDGHSIMPSPRVSQMVDIRRMFEIISAYEVSSKVSMLETYDLDDLPAALKHYDEVQGIEHYEIVGLKEGIIFDEVDGNPVPRLHDIYMTAGNFDAYKIGLARKHQGKRSLVDLWFSFEAGESIDDLMNGQNKSGDYFAVETNKKLISSIPQLFSSHLSDVELLLKRTNSHLHWGFYGSLAQATRSNQLAHYLTGLDSISKALDDFGPITKRMKVHLAQYELFLQMFILRQAMAAKDTGDSVAAIASLKNLISESEEKLLALGKNEDEIEMLKFALSTEPDAHKLFLQMDMIINRIEEETNLFVKLLGAPSDWQAMLPPAAAKPAQLPGRAEKTKQLPPSANKPH